MTDTPDPKPPLIVGSSGDGLVTTDDIVDRIREEKPSVENPPKAAMCEHYWASHVLGGFPIAVRTCQLCRAVDWDDLKRELEVAFGKGSVVRAKRAKSMLRYIKANLADLPGWQEAWFTEAMQVYGGETYQATYTASSSAYQRGMRLAQGHDVPPLPVPTLPTRVDDLDSDTYDALRSRYAWLEQRHRDTAHSEQGVLLAKQAKEIGDLGEQLDEAANSIGEYMSKVNQVTEQVERVRRLADDLCTWLSPRGLDGPTCARAIRDALDGRLWRERLTSSDDTPEQP